MTTLKSTTEVNEMRRAETHAQSRQTLTAPKAEVDCSLSSRGNHLVQQGAWISGEHERLVSIPHQDLVIERPRRGTQFVGYSGELGRGTSFSTQIASWR